MSFSIEHKNKIKWIGEHNSDWEKIRAKYIFRNKSSKNHLNEDLLSVNQKDYIL